MNQKGFTIIELMITVAILAIVVMIGVPSFADVIKKNQIKASLQGFSTALKYARSEGVKQSSSVTICASSDQATCTGNWNQGWVVFKDVDSAGDFDAGTDTLLRVHDAIDTNHTLVFDHATSGRVTFLSRGYTSGQFGTFKLCGPDNEDKYARGIILQKTGSLRYSIDSGGNGIYEDASGSDFSC